MGKILRNLSAQKIKNGGKDGGNRRNEVPETGSERPRFKPCGLMCKSPHRNISKLGPVLWAPSTLRESWNDGLLDKC